jgi:hypothetical protein
MLARETKDQASQANDENDENDGLLKEWMSAPSGESDEAFAGGRREGTTRNGWREGTERGDINLGGHRDIPQRSPILGGVDGGDSKRTARGIGRSRGGAASVEVPRNPTLLPLTPPLPMRSISTPLAPPSSPSMESVCH